MKVNILGTKYTVKSEDYDNDELKGKNRMGYCFFDAKLIVIEDLNTDDEWKNESDKVKEIRRNIILRHEIIHAFLFESGLLQNSSECDAWALNEEMVDWIALQAPKIIKAFKKCGCL